MTLTLFLVRHVPHALQGKIQVGRTEGVGLAEGSAEHAARIGARLRGEGLDAVYSSPVHRARETAAAIAFASGLQVDARDGLNEIDVGHWTGRTFEALVDDPAFEVWNSKRSLARIPGGESMLEVQVRMVGVLEELRRAHPDGRVAAVSHGDPVKSLLLYLLGLPLDDYDRIEIDPGSVSTVVVGDWGAKIVRLNEAA